jgi:hypothetical protein
MKFWVKIIFLTILDYILIWFWVKSIDPDPSVSIGVIILVPFVFIVNISIALILHLRKNPNSKLFGINSVISAILMFYIFSAGISRHHRQRYESWTFGTKDTLFEITFSKLDSTFFISYRLDPSSSSGLLDGKFINTGSEIKLLTDSTEYIIRDNYLYGFNKYKTPIKLTKTESVE